MTVPHLISFAPDTKIFLSGARATKAVFQRGVLDLSAFPDSVRRALGDLKTKPASQDALAEQVLDGADPTQVAWLYHGLGLFARYGLLRYTLEHQGAEILTLRPMARGPLFEPAQVAPEQPYRLSRFAHLRREGDRLMIECPVSATRVWVASKGLARMLFEFETPKAAVDLAKADPADLVESVLGYLLAAKVITPCDAEGRTEEDRDPILRQWEFHDMTFHAHARVGRHCDPLGAHFPFDGVCSSPPALKSVPDSPPIPLFRPELTDLPSGFLAAVMEQRQSWRYFDDTAPITAEQLGTFLYRTARVREVLRCEDGLADRYDQSSRPYPSGGAMYELELYVTVRTCNGLEPGIYYYDPLAHALHSVSGSEGHRAALLNQASISAGRVSVPQVLITMTSRFDRMSWKYNAIAYGTTLKHVGVLMGMMYLAASDMNLAACALGSGLAELAPGEIDLDFFQEAPVGDLMLGSRGTRPSERAVPTAARKSAPSLYEDTQAFMQDPSSLPDPSLLYARLLEEAPIHRTLSGAILISKYQDVAKLISHPLMSVDHRGKAGARGLAQSPEIEPFFESMMSMRNPPDHDRISAPMRASFKAVAVRALKAQIDALVDRNLRPHLTAPSVDIVSAIAKDLPVQVTCAMLGIPREDWPLLQVWTELLARQLSDFTQPPEKLVAAEREVAAFADYIRALLAERRRAPRSEDILTDLLAPAQLSEQELIAQCMLVLIGGRDTVTNMISNSVFLLLQYPAQFAACRKNPDLIPAALEECLRFESPIRMAARSLRGDLDHGSHRLKEGDTLLFLFAAANRDPAHFIDPNRFETARKPKSHFAFGRGTHFCIGHHFARAEGASVLRWMLQNCGAIEELDPPGKPAWESNLVFRGLSHLNIRMHPRH